jgi:hypothetical protein
LRRQTKISEAKLKEYIFSFKIRSPEFKYIVFLTFRKEKIFSFLRLRGWQIIPVEERPRPKKMKGPSLYSVMEVKLGKLSGGERAGTGGGWVGGGNKEYQEVLQ